MLNDVINGLAVGGATGTLGASAQLVRTVLFLMGSIYELLFISLLGLTATSRAKSKSHHR